jgi:hypothetical protein
MKGIKRGNLSPKIDQSPTGSHEMFKRDHEIRKKSVGTWKVMFLVESLVEG